MMEFKALPRSSLRPGLALKLPSGTGEKVKYLRLTHVFERRVFGIWVSTPEAARYARRPTAFTSTEIQALAKQPGACWGRLQMPETLTRPLSDVEKIQLQLTWSFVSPVIHELSKEKNIASRLFTALIKAQATKVQMTYFTMLRLVKRYYYFGLDTRALLELLSGPAPGAGGYRREATQQRRGRKSVLESELGANKFIAGEDDIAEMIETLKSQLRKGPTFLTHAHEAYLSGPFRKRHPKLYEQYTAEHAPEPVTVRQYRYYIANCAALPPDLQENLRGRKPPAAQSGALRSSGPGEIYEIDATGGRIHLVSASKPPVLLGRPYIYLAIDRWSRYVVAVYVTTKAPSLEEVGHTLLVGLTSRARFKRLGIDIDDTEWPIAGPPAVLCCDRGAEFLSDGFEETVAAKLRTELVILPPLCPDGKAIVERLIREVKRRMAARRMAGSYADRPMNPKSKRVYKKAETVAVHTLVDIYRVLVEIVRDHNTRPHSTLRKYKNLAASGIPPVPREAYLWGMANITGLDVASFTDQEYVHLLLESANARAAGGVLHYRNNIYEPADAPARIASKAWKVKSQSVSVKLDKADPHELWYWTRQQWAVFRRKAGQVVEAGGLTAEDEDLLAPRQTQLWAKSDYTSRIRRVKERAGSVGPEQKKPAKKVPQENRLLARQEAASLLKAQLKGAPAHEQSPPVKARPSEPSWQELQERERARQLEVIRASRRMT